MSDYHCAECGLSATVATDGGTITRTCAHTGTVIAERSATLYGEGGTSDRAPSLSERISAALDKIAASFRGG